MREASITPIKPSQSFVLSTPKGPFYALLAGDVLLRCGFGSGTTTHLNPVAAELRRALVRFFSGGQWEFGWVKLYQQHLSPKARTVYEYLRKNLGPGQTISYGELAAHCHTSPRAVGRFMAMNPWPVVVPCHRVVRSDGSLGGYSGGIDVKKWLIDLEQSNGP